MRGQRDSPFNVALFEDMCRVYFKLDEIKSKNYSVSKIDEAFSDYQVTNCVNKNLNYFRSDGHDLECNT